MIEELKKLLNEYEVEFSEYDGKCLTDEFSKSSILDLLRNVHKLESTCSLNNESKLMFKAQDLSLNIERYIIFNFK